MIIPIPPEEPSMRSSKVIAEAYSLGKLIGFNYTQTYKFINNYLLHPSDRYRTTNWIRRERWTSGRETPKAEVVLAFQEFSELCRQNLGQRFKAIKEMKK